jgi:hypothetical protein
MESHGAAWWISSLAASRAKTSLSPEKEEDLTVSEAASGLKCLGSLARFDLDSRLWKTHQFSLLGDLEPFSETWPRWGMMRGGECWELSTPELRTNENESGLWRSPAAREPGVSWERLETRTGEPVGSMCRHYDKHTGRMAQIGLTQQVKARMWPTPQAHKTTRSGEIVNVDGTPWDGIRKPHSKTTGRQITSCLADAVAMWPTPCATDHKGAGKTGELRDRLDYATERGGTKSKTYPVPPESGGQLNPTWVEWLMGWPLGWTDSAQSATAKFREWCASHGIS